MLSASLLGGPDDSRKGGPTIKKIAHLLLLLICSRMIDTGGNVSRNGVSLLENPTTHNQEMDRTRFFQKYLLLNPVRQDYFLLSNTNADSSCVKYLLARQARWTRRFEAIN